ncbi:dimethyladenosine transferase [Geothermobacter ehrlichii]|uniref:Ribosomal RNA small subunit methyltransferase A n=1 Tax=Geothermobacter ehrlichii TaxID=213224 RepID=A0A5D3WLP1_9BACT|nr:16S rRNA (adenine(1518)-N(6)/adenine(1519)-N(6))-dimethyltransferase RsmA [Geothermobacter ehrlichii]TYO99632.1 dimethyladenosine transferase [Geothermobacter ehrlichii]
MNQPRHRARKRFGQNFLRDQNIVARILQAAELAESDRVLEIGPGTGALTDGLLQLAGEVVVMELDRDLVAYWQQRRHPGLRVVSGDALRLDWSDILGREPVKMVANLPYNISSQILFRIIEHRRLFKRLVLMFQKEVGDRLLASPGSRDYGILSVFAQLWFDISRVCNVPPQAFRPAPRVDSVVLLFKPLGGPRVDVVRPELFDRLVRGAFRQRRKTLRNTLQSAGFVAADLDRAFELAGIEPTRRGETLSLEDFANLTRALARQEAP